MGAVIGSAIRVEKKRSRLARRYLGYDIYPTFLSNYQAKRPHIRPRALIKLVEPDDRVRLEVNELGAIDCRITSGPNAISLR